MRAFIAMCVLVSACGNENAGVEAAKKQADEEQAKKIAASPAKTITPPVPGRQKVPCSTLVDPAKYQAALGEKDPMTVLEEKGDGEAAASCSLVRGGKRPTPAEQAAMLKQKSRLGVMNGDPTCTVTAYCWTIENLDRFKAKCKERKETDDQSMGTYACVQTVATGEDDVQVFRFFDEDTKCILQVRGGPSMVDNDYIRKCAITARDTIGPDQIKP
ncbi:MAG TPA: hypothetical protein VGM88_02890 [Kofleriaceae bacterium]|jgi:hypothetical protein